MLLVSYALAALLPAALACFEGHTLSTQDRLRARQVSGAVTSRTPIVFDWDFTNQSWSSISPAYSVCSTGQRQSPIALSTESNRTSTVYPTFSSDFGATHRGQFYNARFGVYFTLSQPSKNYTTLPSMQITDTAKSGQPCETVYLAGWHTHTPAEHVLDGPTPQGYVQAEIHFVFYNATGAPRAVVGAHLVVGQGGMTPFFAQYPTPWPARDTQDKQTELSVDFSTLTGMIKGSYLSYDGSLTTPPCTEGLKWFFNKRALEVEPWQMREILRVGDFSSRNLNEIKAQFTPV